MMHLSSRQFIHYALSLSAAACLSATPALATKAQTGDSPACTADMPKDQVCTVRISELHPTQLSFGAIEVEQRAAKFAAKSAEKMQDPANQPPIIAGPGGVFYITDKHHMALAYAKIAGHDALIYAKIEQNWSTLDQTTFWQNMATNDYTYLYDENGQGPLTVASLANDLFELHDDSYRSLAWGVRKNDGYSDSTFPHADFLWANFFRSRVDAGAITSDFDTAVADGTSLAQSPAASTLPGYSGPAARTAPK